jgi:tetratricopeptide (TPR) repeat protein
MRLQHSALLVTALVPALTLAQERHPSSHAHDRPPALGTVAFPNSGNAAAQTPFIRGIAFLHSFEYEHAADAFLEAQRADPSFALAYWAEALTYSHVLWRTEDLASSRAALRRFGSTPAARLAKAPTHRERAFGAAVEAFYMDGTLSQRVRAYADSLHRLARSDPDDHEAAAFASHALMLNSYVGDPADRESSAREAIALAQRVAAANPHHPGATHYLIHLYDTPGMAARGLAFARAYDRIAPDAEHALHMPSHIYLQLGMWADVVRSNERAWAASRAGTSNPAHLDWHAFSWLQYGYLQQGRFRAARALIDSARAILSGVTTSYADASVVIPRLEFQYASETDTWTSVSHPRNSDALPASERERAFRQFARYWLAVDAAMRRDADLAAIAAPYLAIADSVPAGGARSLVMSSNALVVAALVARARGDTSKYRESLLAAADIERRLTAFVGPPERVFALELLGADLHSAGSHADAARAYEDVIRICPERSRALIGLHRAKLALSDSAGAAAVSERLKTNYLAADRGR